MTAPSSPISIGVDPGLRGGMARLEGSSVLVETIPIIPGVVRNGKKISRDQYDIPAIKRRILDWISVYSSPDGSSPTVTVYRHDVSVFVEQSIPLPPNLKAGSLAQFQRGVCRGWTWLLTALGISHELIHPKTWQTAMLRDTPGKDTKARSILAAQRLFPTVNLRRTARAKKDDDGLTDALLIAEYGRRRRAGELRSPTPTRLHPAFDSITDPCLKLQP